MSAWSPRSLSVVAPLYNEEANAEPLVRAIRAGAARAGLPFEIVLVDDGSSDGTLDALRRVCAEVPEAVVVALRRNFGQTLALQAGLDRARGDAIVTIDGDLQNDPGDIPLLLERLVAGADVVSGWRRQRRDDLVLRKFPSWMANRLIRAVTRIPIHDQGCALKAYRGEVIRQLDLYGDLHRFIAILTLPLGARIEEVEVRHHPRAAGESKYGILRTFEVLADLFAVQLLVWFRESPLRFFATLGLPFLVLAATSALLSLVSGYPTIVFPAVSFICGITFGACVLVGLLGEWMIEARGRGKSRHVVAREWEGVS